MPQRIPVHVRGLDPISETGVITQLRSRPELTVVPAMSDRPEVVVAVADVIGPPAIELIRGLRGEGAARIITVLSAPDDAALLAAVEAGVCGVVSRAEATPERLTTAITHAAAMEGVLSPKLLGRLLEQVSRLQNQVLAPRGLHLSGISEREATVLRLIAQGNEIKEIAAELCYSERTIKNTLHDVVSRFHLRNRTHAVAFALQEGLI
ncbi:response regulator transcription factor [Amycolatopsis sp. PS_44_ISF1]|uniref:response regulator transcription factor n=1 Tax=Amycolatopsis sp. PS_44_ISF1 TaxID=2974917 RepID=UPI0028DFBEBC|nr:response regulator transcription factor [Amycolatopsis sp. PS_44_ISF1]MDT8913140.1 response regulator transcription factor [Amycolatopsis sp. PS_44_ISF1]